MFPKSAIAAFAKESFPKNSKIKGKQDNPGAKEGINNCALLPEGDVGETPIIFNKRGWHYKV